LAQACRQVETAALPVARQVLGATRNRAVLVNDAGAADADQGCQSHLVLSTPIDQLLQHADELFDGVVTFYVLLAMAPQARARHLRLAEVAGLAEIELDHPGADVGATNVDRENCLVALQHPGRQQMRGTDKTGMIRIVANELKVDGNAVGLEQEAGTCDRQLADATGAKAAADDEAFGVPPI